MIKKMNDCKIKLYRSATVGIISKEFKLLCDPWLTDGEYYGSWSHYPPFDLDKNIDEINSYDAMYISHIHPDHCSEDTLKRISKDIPVYILSYHSKFLKFKIERLGFKVIEISNFEKIQFTEDFSLSVIAADNCDPELCYKFNGCADVNVSGESQQIDSLSLITCGNKNILNINDCPYELANSMLDKITDLYEIDCLLLGYGGAGPYPQCFDNLSLSEKASKALDKKKKFLDMSINYIEKIKPKYYLPFAGTYTLTGKLSKMQDLRGVPSLEETYNYLEKNFKQTNSQCIKLNPDASFSLHKLTYSELYKCIENREIKDYIDNILSKKKFDYENDEEVTFEELLNLSNEAIKRFIKKKRDLKITLDTDVLLKFESKFIHIDNNIDEILIKNNNDLLKIKKYVIYDVDPKLLKRILSGPRYAHWNNSEIGSHIKFFRHPDIFDRKVYNVMSYFHV
jgi:UDP-MurNAc hydroxylase